MRCAGSSAAIRANKPCRPTQSGFRGGRRASRLYCARKRPRESVRSPMTSSASSASSRVRPGLSASATRSRRVSARERANRRQRIVDLVANDPYQPLPREALFLTQRLAQVSDDEQVLREAGFAKDAVRDLPAATVTRYRCDDACSPAPFQEFLESHFDRTAADRKVRRTSRRRPAAGFASRSWCALSNANTATSIELMSFSSSAVASIALSRCSCRVLPRSLISPASSPSASRPLARRPRTGSYRHDRLRSHWRGRAAAAR